MGVEPEVCLAPITREDVPEVAAFLHRELNPRLSTDQWARSILPPWATTGPNHGFLLRSAGRVVGVNVAFYSERELAGGSQQFCNLAAWCVSNDFRAHGVRLLRALLSQHGYTFTDLSPSGNVVAINERLRFQHLDTTTALVPHLPRRTRGVRVVTCQDEIAGLLTPSERRIFLDHRHAGAAIHVVLVTGDRHCYVVARRDRRKRLPVFTSLLYVSDPSLMPVVGPRLYTHLLRRGAIATLAETRVAGTAPPVSWRLPRSRPKMFKSADLAADHIDYLYSELTCVAW